MVVCAEDTISAIATPPGSGGIGVVRISGSRAREVLKALWRGTTSVQNFEARKLYLGEIHDLDQQNVRLDRVLAVFMPAPRTYTGQDVVELSCHGSPVVLSRILEASISSGARLADPGEFTRRAFLAGKLDLAQAEGVCDLISAVSERAARLATSQLDGRLSDEVVGIGSELADIRAFLEASIDFPEEDIGESDVFKRLLSVTERARLLVSTFREGRLIRDGVRVAIVGPANAGKSSILNRLVGCDRAIVHADPGTTRDVVCEIVDIDGVAFHLSDTAGFRVGAEGVEVMGAKLSEVEIELSDIVLAVFDGSMKRTPDEEKIFADIQSAAEGRSLIIIANKSDLVGGGSQTFGSEDIIHASALSGHGMDEIRGRMKESCAGDAFESGIVVTSIRHKTSLDAALLELERASGAILEMVPSECVAQHLSSAQESLGEITGEVVTEELLDRIFSKFCIGK